MATNIPPHNLGEVIDATVAPDRQPRRHARRPHAVRQGPRLPDRRARSWAGPASSTPTAPAAARSACGRGPRSRRARSGAQIVVTEMPVPDVGSNAIVAKIAELVNDTRASRASATIQRRVRGRRHAARHRARSATPTPTSSSTTCTSTRRCRRPSRVNMVALVDGVPAHAQPARRLHALRRPPGRGHHPPVGVPPRQGPRPGPHRRGPAQGARHDRRDHRRHPGLGRQAGGARRRCMAAPFEFSEMQADHILDMHAVPPHPPRSGTSSRRRWRSCARPSPSSRRSSPTTPSCGRSSRPRSARSATSSPRPRRAEITFDPGDIERRGPHRRRGARRHHDEGRATSRPSRPTPSAPRAAAAVGWPARKLQGRGLRHGHHPHLGPRVPAVLLEPGPGLPAQGARDPDEGPHRPGHGRSSTCCRSQPDEHIQAIIDTRDYETNRYLFFATKQRPGEEDADVNEYDKSPS